MSILQNLADSGADYTVKLKKKRDRNKDGYFYIDTGNVLHPGTLYEFSVHRFNRYRYIKHVDVFTGKEIAKDQVETTHGNGKLIRSLRPNQLFLSFLSSRNIRISIMLYNFIDCEDFTYYCVTSYRPTCLEPAQLCDDRQDCVDGSDEEKVGETW